LQVYKDIIFSAGFAGQMVLNKDPTLEPEYSKNTFTSIKKVLYGEKYIDKKVSRIETNCIKKLITL